MGDPPQECGRRQSQSGSNETGDTQRFLPGVDKIRKYPKHTKMMNNLKEWFQQKTSVRSFIKKKITHIWKRASA